MGATRKVVIEGYTYTLTESFCKDLDRELKWAEKEPVEVEKKIVTVTITKPAPAATKPTPAVTSPKKQSKHTK